MQPPKMNTTYDLVVFGATGFTGLRVALEVERIATVMTRINTLLNYDLTNVLKYDLTNVIFLHIRRIVCFFFPDCSVERGRRPIAP